jgi:hypothetical protein
MNTRGVNCVIVGPIYGESTEPGQDKHQPLHKDAEHPGKKFQQYVRPQYWAKISESPGS